MAAPEQGGSVPSGERAHGDWRGQRSRGEYNESSKQLINQESLGEGGTASPLPPGLPAEAYHVQTDDQSMHTLHCIEPFLHCIEPKTVQFTPPKKFN